MDSPVPISHLELGAPALWWFEYAWHMGSSTIGRCGLIGRGVALLDKRDPIEAEL